MKTITQTGIIDDIPCELAMRAHAGTSMSPERRGEQTRADYVFTYSRAAEAIEKLAQSPEQQAVMKSELARYRTGLAKRWIAMLQAQSRVMSTMITGPANFPVRRQQKLGGTSDKRRGEMLDFDKRAIAAMKKAVQAAATPEQRAEREGNRLKSEAM